MTIARTGGKIQMVMVMISRRQQNMKAKLLLGLLPAILALSSCAGVAPKDEVENFEFFQEDTLIHDELFDDSQSVFLTKAIKNLAPVDSSEPRIGVQKSTTYTYNATSCVAIRFVAAVNLPNIEEASVQWDRAVYTDSGSVHNSISGLLDVEKAYTTISDDNGDVSISSYPGYTHFVTYTVRNVPVDHEDYVVTASLTVNGVSNNKTVATSIDLTRQVAFPKDTTGYFLAGTFNGNPGIAIEEEYFVGENDKTAFVRGMKEGDSFLVVLNNPSTNHFEIFSDSISVNDTLFKKENHKIVAKSDGDFLLIFSKDGNLYSDTAYFYLWGSVNGWKGDGPANAEGCIFSYDEESYSYTLSKTLAVDDEFGLRIRVGSNNVDGDFFQNKYNWPNSGFRVSSGGNIKMTVAGTYTIRLFLNDSNNKLGFEKEGINPRPETDIFLVYSADEDSFNYNQKDGANYLLRLSSNDNYKYELTNVSLETGYFVVTTYGTRSRQRWQWNGYFENDVQAFFEGPEGDARGQGAVDWNGSDVTWYVHILKAGSFSIYITNTNRLRIDYSAG